MKSKNLFLLFVVLGIIYVALEVAWNAIFSIPSNGLSLIGHTSLWMLVVGGCLGIILGLFNEIKSVRNSFNVFWQSFIGAIIINLVEFLSGLILNIACDFGIWDYSDYAFNLLGQICLPMALVWFIICPFVFWLDDVIRYFIYDEGNLYNILDVYKDLPMICKKTNYQD